jgi:hypothetical protein
MPPKGQKRSLAPGVAAVPAGKRAKVQATEKPSKKPKQKEPSNSSDDEELQRALAQELELDTDDDQQLEEEEEEEEAADSDSEGSEQSDKPMDSDDDGSDGGDIATISKAKKKDKAGGKKKLTEAEVGKCISCLKEPEKDRGSEIAFEEEAVSVCIF